MMFSNEKENSYTAFEFKIDSFDSKRTAEKVQLFTENKEHLFHT